MFYSMFENFKLHMIMDFPTLSSGDFSLWPVDFDDVVQYFMW